MKMQIKTTAWHHRILVATFTTPSNSLCIYFWQVVGTLGMFLFMGLLIAILVFTALAPILTIFFPILYTTGFFAVGMMMWLAIFVCWYTEYRKTCKRRAELRGEPETDPNIVVEYVRAAKDKVCPILEFVDE